MSNFEQRLKAPNIAAILKALREAFFALAPGASLTLEISEAPPDFDPIFALEHLGFGNVQVLERAGVLEVRAKKMSSFRLERFERLNNSLFQVDKPTATTPSEGRSKVTVIISLDTTEADLHETIQALESQEFPDWQAVVVADSLPSSLCSHPKILSGSFGDSTSEYVIELKSGDKLHSRFLKQAISLLESDRQLDFIYSHSLESAQNQKLLYLPLLSKKVKASELLPIPALFRHGTWRCVREITNASARTKLFWDQLDYKNGKLIPEPLCSLKAAPR